MNKSMGKRGSLQDLIYLMTILLTLAITIVFAAYLANRLNGSGMFNDVNGVNNNNVRLLYNNTINGVLPQFDNIFLGVLVGGIIMTIILAFALRSWTVFIVVGFIFTAVLVMLAAILGNVYGIFAENSQISSTAASFTAITFVMSHLPLIILGAAILICIVLYGLWRIAL